MQNLTLDLILFFTIIGMACLFPVWPLLYPYIGSYVKHIHKDISFNALYYNFAVVYMGMFAGNALLPKLFFILGIRKTVQVGSFLYVLNCVLFTQWTTLMGFYFNVATMGFVIQFFMFTAAYFFTEKYENGLLYIGYVAIGGTAGSFFWPFILNIMVNPDNELMTEVNYINGHKESYYSYGVSMRMKGFMFLHGFVVFLTNFLLSRFIQNPEKHQSKVSLWFKNFINRNPVATEEMKSQYEIYQKDYRRSISSSYRKSIAHHTHIPKRKVDKDVELLDRTPSYERIESITQLAEQQENDRRMQIAKEARAELKSSRFICLMMITGIKCASPVYFMNNFKYMADYIVKNDTLTSNIFSFSAITGTIGRLVSVPIWKYLDFEGAYIMNLVVDIVFNLFFIFISANNPMAFLVQGLVGRLTQSYSYSINSFTVFGLYGVEKGLYLVKVYDTSMFFAIIYTAVLNSVIVEEGSYTMIFWFFIVTEIGALYLFYKMFMNRSIRV